MSMTVKLPDEFMSKLNEFDERTEEIIEKTLEAGAEIVFKQAKSNLSIALASFGTSDESTGQLKGALGITPVKPSDDGYNIKIGFAEPRQNKKGASTYSKKRKSGKKSEYQLTNAMVASIIEYGKKNQAARPFMKPAQDATKNKARDEMKRVFTEEAQKIMK